MNPELVIQGFDYKPLSIHDGTVFHVTKVDHKASGGPTVDYLAMPQEKACQTTLEDFARRVAPVPSHRRKQEPPPFTESEN